MSALFLLLAVLTIFAAGLGLHLWLGQNEEPDLGETFGMAWLLGCGFISLALALLGLCARGFILQLLVTALCLALGALGVRCWREKKKTPAASTLLHKTLCALLILGLGGVGFLCWHAAFVWDGVLIWEAKARFAFLNGGALPAPYFSDASRLWSHPDYPLLLPLTETWAYLWLGDCDQFWIKFLFPIFYAAGAALLYSGTKQATASIRAGLLVALIFFFLPYPCFGDWGLLQGYADFPLGVMYLAAGLSLQKFLRLGTSASAARFALLSGFLPWIKNEGVLLWLVLLLVTYGHSSARRGRWWWLPLPGLLLWGGWKFFLHHLHAVADEEFMPVNLATLQHNLPRLSVITRQLAQQLLDWREWSLLWCGFAAALFWTLLNQRTSARNLPLFLAVLLPLLLDASIFLFSGWPSPEKYLDHVTTALPRLIFQLTPLAALLIGQRATSTFSTGN